MKGTMTQMRDVADRPTFEICPEGDHLVEITEKGERDTKNADLMVMLTMEIVSGPHKGKKLWDNIIMCDNPESPAWKIRWRSKMFLKAIGEPHHGDAFEYDTDRWAFKRCMVNVVHEIQKEGQYAGNPKAIVKKYSPMTVAAGALAGKKAVEDDADVPF
jgi:hypothetical protein